MAVQNTEQWSQQMEGSLFIPVNRPRRLPDVVCADCGQLFRPRWIGDGAEELCNSCYEDRFRPLPFQEGRELAQ